jgi:hypothetical protein
MDPKSKKVIIVVLVFIDVMLLTYIAFNTYESKRSSFPPFRYHFQYHRRSISINDISSWMTFDYINKIFNLPSTYFKETYQIKDKKYPILTIKQYTTETKTNTTLFVINIQKTIQAYLESSSIPKP